MAPPALLRRRVLASRRRRAPHEAIEVARAILERSRTAAVIGLRVEVALVLSVCGFAFDLNRKGLRG